MKTTELERLREEWEVTEKHAGSIYCGIKEGVPSCEYFGDLFDMMASFYQILIICITRFDKCLEFLDQIAGWDKDVSFNPIVDNTYIFAEVENRDTKLEAPRDIKAFGLNYFNAVCMIADDFGCTVDYILDGIRCMILHDISRQDHN